MPIIKTTKRLFNGIKKYFNPLMRLLFRISKDKLLLKKQIYLVHHRPPLELTRQTKVPLETIFKKTFKTLWNSI